jgi:hypothetical protein
MLSSLLSRGVPTGLLPWNFRCSTFLRYSIIIHSVYMTDIWQCFELNNCTVSGPSNNSYRCA